MEMQGDEEISSKLFLNIPSFLRKYEYEFKKYISLENHTTYNVLPSYHFYLAYICMLNILCSIQIIGSKLFTNYGNLRST